MENKTRKIFENRGILSARKYDYLSKEWKLKIDNIISEFRGLTYHEVDNIISILSEEIKSKAIL
jgi:hypothetical protein